MFDSITAVIPIRNGYKEVEDNSLLSFGEVTLLEWKLIQLKHVLPASRIWVSTNSQKAMEIANQCGVKVAGRGDDECVDEVPFSTTVRGILKYVDGENIAICPCTSPFIAPKNYVGAFDAYLTALNEGRNASLVAVNEHKEYLRSASGPVNYSVPNVVRQSKLEMLYRVTNGLFIMSKKRMVETGYFIDGDPCLFVLPMLAGMDINHFDDYCLTRELLSYYISHTENKR